MKLKRNYILLALFLAVSLFLPQQVNAQDTLLVSWETAPGSNLVQINALRDAVANNPGKIFKLQWGGFYHNTDPIENQADNSVVIVGQTFAEALAIDPLTPEWYGPAIIQRVHNSEGNAPGQMFNAFGDLTVINVWLMGQTDQGVRSAYEPIKLLGDGKRYIFDRVIFDRNDWHHLGPDAPNVKVYVTNSKFRNLFGPTQQWEGIGIRFEVGADTVVFENNTFLNVGFTPFQSEAAPINYFRCNHNTFVNVGRNFSAGSLWKTVYVVNNIFVNTWWHGEDASQYNSPDRIDPYAGFFSIAAIDPSHGTNEGREILVTRNSYWRDPQFQPFYDGYTPDPIRAQPFINDTTQGWFDAYPGNMKFFNNYIGENPGVTTYPLNQAGLFDSMTAHISYFYEGGATNSPRYYFDPLRDETPAGYILNIWPLGENFTYTNATLRTGATDGLSLGDLNWYPGEKATWEANKETYVQDIENIIRTPTITVESRVEAEVTTLEGDAQIKYFQGFTYVAFEGAGNVVWNFDMLSAATVDLVVYTRSNDARRGQHIRVNGVGIRNFAGGGEFNWWDLDPVIWKEHLITVDTLLADPPEIRLAMNLAAGPNTIEIAPSWGYQSFYGIDVIVGTDTLHKLRIPNAVQPVNAPVVAEGFDYVPSSFAEVSLGAGGSVSFNVNAPISVQYMLQLFYANSGSPSVQLEVDGVVTSPSIILTDTGDVVTDLFNLTAGTHTIKITSPAGGVNLDYIQLLSYVLGVEIHPEQPTDFSLSQNYPNPFNPATKIDFKIAQASNVRISIYNILGQRVTTLIDTYMNAGSYTVDFDASRLASGVYFYSLEAGDFKFNKKMMLLK